MTDKRGTGLKFDGGKLRPTLLPTTSLEKILEVLEFGANKYSANGWQGVDDGYNRYFDALYRHLYAAQRGEKLDEESGLPHLAHAGCCLLFMLHLEDLENAK
jgi:hypothetical protein